MYYAWLKCTSDCKGTHKIKVYYAWLKCTMLDLSVLCLIKVYYAWLKFTMLD